MTVKRILKSLGVSDGVNLVLLTGSYEQDSKITFLRLTSNVRSRPIQELPDSELGESRTERSMKFMQNERQANRVELQLLERISENDPWLVISQVNLINRGMPYYPSLLRGIIDIDGEFELQAGCQLAVRQQDVGHGLLASGDTVTIHGTQIVGSDSLSAPIIINLALADTQPTINVNNTYEATIPVNPVQLPIEMTVNCASNSPSPSPTPTPTPIPTNYDSDANAYFNAISNIGGFLALNHKELIDDFVIALKTSNYWNDLQDCGLFLGGTVGSVPLKLKGSPMTITGLSVDSWNNWGLQGNGETWCDFTNLAVVPETGLSILTRIKGQTSDATLLCSLGDSEGIAQFGAYAVIYLGVGGAANGSLSGDGNFWLVGANGTGTSKAYKNSTEVGSLFTGTSWLPPNPNKIYLLGSPSQPKANGTYLGGFCVFNKPMSIDSIANINVAWDLLMTGLGR